MDGRVVAGNDVRQDGWIGQEEGMRRYDGRNGRSEFLAGLKHRRQRTGRRMIAVRSGPILVIMSRRIIVVMIRLMPVTGRRTQPGRRFVSQVTMDDNPVK